MNNEDYINMELFILLISKGYKPLTGLVKRIFKDGEIISTVQLNPRCTKVDTFPHIYDIQQWLIEKGYYIIPKSNGIAWTWELVRCSKETRNSLLVESYIYYGKEGVYPSYAKALKAGIKHTLEHMY